jgi:TolA-binding protein
MIASRKQLVIAASLGLFLTMGVAQEQAHSQSFLSPSDVQDCLCREQALQSMRQQNDALQTQLNDARAQVQDLQSKIDNMRSTMNPNDSAAVRKLSDMIMQRDALNNQYRSTVFPQAWSSTSKLNTAVDEYNQRCSGRAMRTVDVDSAKANMASCPAP